MRAYGYGWAFVLLSALGCDRAPAQMHAADGSGGGKADDAAVASSMVELDSREYKLLLRTEMFAGDPQVAVDELWEEIEDMAEAGGHEPDDPFDKLRARRVTLLDQAGACPLRRAGLALRHREEEGEAELTLKVRSPDRYQAALAPVGSGDPDAEHKLEEDVIAPFSSKFSRSVTVEAEPEPEPEALGDVWGNFEGLDALGIDPPVHLAPVGGQTIEERAYKGADLRLAGTKAKFTVTLWYLGEPIGEPEVAEVSFKYSRGDEGFDFETARAAADLFGRLATLDGWISTDATTKTAFAYGLDPQFCDDP